jgi:hypothetical protein
MPVVVGIPSQPNPPAAPTGVQTGVTGDPGYHSVSDGFTDSTLSVFSTVISNVTPTYVTAPADAIKLVTAGNAADKAEYTSQLEPVILTPNSSIRATFRFIVSDATNTALLLGLVENGATQTLVTDGAFMLKASGTATPSCYHAKGAASAANYVGGSSGYAIASNVWQTLDIMLTCGPDGATGSARFWLNGAQVYDTELLQVTTAQLYLFFALTGGTATVKTVQVDYIGRIYGG